jgi:hypothetical protein
MICGCGNLLIPAAPGVLGTDRYRERDRQTERLLQPSVSDFLRTLVLYAKVDMMAKVVLNNWHF